MPKITVTVNGTQRTHDVEGRLLLVHYLRDVLGLTGTHVGCDTSSCGACTIHLDGNAVKSCSMLAAQADGAIITTIAVSYTHLDVYKRQYLSPVVFV